MLTDAGVFEEAYRPDRLLHREGELDAVVHGLDDGSVTDHRPSGVGKTTLAMHALGILEAERNVPTAHVECLGATTATILRQTLWQFPGPNPASNTAQEDLSLRLYERVDDPAVVVLDEAAHVHCLAALDRLLDIPELRVIVVCHDADEWLSTADRQTRDRFSETTVRVDRFALNELADVLAARAHAGLRNDAWTRAQLVDIADDAAGVARTGIQTLYQAAMESEHRGYGEIEDTVLTEARDLAKRRILEHNLQSLPVHHQILYALVRQTESVAAEDLHARYDTIPDDAYANRRATPLSKRARRRKLQKLSDYGLVVVEGTNRD